MGNQPSIFTKSPQEHAKEFHQARCNDEEGFHSYAPPGYARVHFYFRIDDVKRNRKPDIVADVPLDRSGSLNLNIIKDMWGLIECKAIDPYRYQLFEPVVPGTLSAWAVKGLAYQKAIYVTETGAENGCLARRIRMVPIDFCDGFIVGMGEYASLITVPHRAIVHAEKHLQCHRSQYQFALLLLLLLFIALAACGIIDLNLHRRFYNWARTGSIGL